MSNNPIESKNQIQFVAKEEKENDEILLKYKWSDKYLVEINPNCFCPDCTHCSCCHFLDSAVCIHLVGCCDLDSIGFPVLKKLTSCLNYKPVFFTRTHGLYKFFLNIQSLKNLV
ncbi:hypothetical protein BpHYR1_026700 [Brachionus plicatilis]|uniref:SWIM-type domain-containing protein n=1 Tax=Brachionus plicatilis TaxID=10195 RepID=A0A3M7Q697_BRAPC|nr:hypothetical protein BpHYR1_026700 [Brachionus plicatilis]